MLPAGTGDRGSAARVPVVVAVVAAGLLLAPPLSAGVVTVAAGDSLSRLAERHLGGPLEWPAILLATNRRLGDGLGLGFLGSPNDLSIGQKVFVPDEGEAKSLLARWRAYERAVVDMSLPEPWEVRTGLAVVTGPATMVTWAREGQFREPYPTRADGDLWVTVEPHLRDFCRSYRLRDRLVERLEERLGLPPVSNKAAFVRIELGSTAGLFRPCSDPRPEVSGCRLPDSRMTAESPYDWFPLWFYQQYHSAYATALPTRYPWTSLGYTYDWGSDDKVGEAEFIVRDGTPIRVLEVVPTERYCTPAPASEE